MNNVPATFVRNIGKKSSIKEFAEDHEGSYLLNHAKSNVRERHEEGHTGKNVIVAVIDTGLRPGYEHLLEDAVIGCEDILDPTSDDACSSDANSGHGTFTAGLIAANAIFQFDPADMFLQSVGIHAPSAILSDDNSDKSNKSSKSSKSSKSGKSDKSGEDNLVAMIGSAPNAEIYALRVFDNDGLRGRAADIFAAVDRVIELKTIDGLNIGVVNMSFGRRTFNPGQGFLQSLVDTLLDYDILPVAAVGNSGPSAATTASPAASIETLAVAAGSVPHQERIIADVACGASPGFGSMFRPFDGTQTANFSSRGPNADGRPGPDVIAAGFGLFGQGLSEDRGQDPTSDRVSLGFGTSFSTPLTAGIAAVLRGKFKGMSARQVRNAIIESANPSILEDGSTAMDRGRGWVDAEEAFELLDDNEVSDLTPIPPVPNVLVSKNFNAATALTVHQAVDGFVVEETGFLLPGERYEIFFEIPANTAEVTVQIHNVEAENPPGGQNTFFDDTIRLSAHSAKTSSIVSGDYFDLNADEGSVAAFMKEGEDRTFVMADFDFDASLVPPSHLVVFDNLEPGILRITVSGDTLNLGRISADVMISSSTISRPNFTATGSTALDCCAFVFIPEFKTSVVAEFRLSWDGDADEDLFGDGGWAHYPANDLDMFLFNAPFTPPRAVAFTLDSPEVLTLTLEPEETGRLWLVFVDGFEVNTGTDTWELRVKVGDTVILP